MMNTAELKEGIKNAVLFAALAFASQALAVESVDETKAADADGLVTVKVVRGTVDMVGWDKEEVRVVGTLDEELEEFIFDADGDHTHIEVKIRQSDSGSWYSRSKGSELTVYLPANSEVEFGGVSTDVTANDIDGELDISNVSGDVQVGPGTGEADLNSVSGNINVRGRVGELQANSVSGDVIARDNIGPGEYASVSGDLIISNVGTELELSTISGDIELVTSILRVAEGQSVSGDIDIMTDLDAEGSIELETISGNIDLRLGGEVDARFTLETGSGRIKNRLTDDEPEISRYMRDESLRFRIGGRDMHIEMSSQSGDLTVRPR